MRGPSADHPDWPGVGLMFRRPSVDYPDWPGLCSQEKLSSANARFLCARSWIRIQGCTQQDLLVPISFPRSNKRRPGTGCTPVYVSTLA